MLNISYFCQIVVKFELFRQISKNIQASNFIKKSVQWEQSCSIRTDRHNEANNSFSLLLKRLKTCLEGGNLLFLYLRLRAFLIC